MSPSSVLQRQHSGIRCILYAQATLARSLSFDNVTQII